MQSQINELYQALHLLSKKLSKKDYELVAGVMFQLYMGERFGYMKSLDGRFLQDIKLIFDLNKGKKINRKAKILKLRVIKGGKGSDKTLQ